MPGKSPILVRILLDDRGLTRRWKNALVDCELFRLQADDGHQPGPTAAWPDVLIVSPDAALDGNASRRARQGELAVIQVTAGKSPDVSPPSSAESPPQTSNRDRSLHVQLPATASPHEMRLVCQLLGQMVHLRRAARRSLKRRRHLARLADTDPLTGLLNRRAWQKMLRNRLRERPEEGLGHCLVMVDLDHFKRINDSCGYAAGDKILARVGGDLRKAVRAEDTVARLGGDEYALLLANISETAASAVVERLHARTATTDSAALENFTASLGYVWFRPSAEIDEAMIEGAVDRALRSAKLAGRNRVVAGHVT